MGTDVSAQIMSSHRSTGCTTNILLYGGRGGGWRDRGQAVVVLGALGCVSRECRTANPPSTGQVVVPEW